MHSFVMRDFAFIMDKRLHVIVLVCLQSTTMALCQCFFCLDKVRKSRNAFLHYGIFCETELITPVVCNDLF